MCKKKDSKMSINSIVNQYYQFSQTKGTKGDGGSLQASYEDNVLTFSEADGDAYSINALNLDTEDIEALSGLLGVDVSEKTEKSDSDKKTNELRDSANTKQSEIEKADDEIKEIFDKTLDEQEKITKNEYKRILDLVNNSVAEFLQARKSGKEVDVADLNSTITQGVENSTYEKDIADVFANLEGANSKIQELSTLLMEYGAITEEAKTLDAAHLEDLQANSAISEGELALIESTSLSFLCNNFFEIGTEKLNGNKEQFTMVSNFKQLDDSIINMYKDYAQSASSEVQTLMSEEANANNEQTKTNKKAKVIKQTFLN